MKTKVFLFMALIMSSSYTFSQKYLWSSQYGVTDVATTIKQGVVDKQNNACLVGSFTGATLTIGDKEVTGLSVVLDAYVAKFTPEKTCVFASSIKSASGSVNVQGVGTDATGNVFVAGTYESEAQMTTSVKVESDYKDFFVAKYDPTGNPVWLKTSNSGTDPLLKSIAVDKDGNFVVTGTFAGLLNVDINGGETEILSNDSESAFFIAKYDGSGKLLWSKTSAGTGTGTGTNLSVDEKGDIYVVGQYSGSISFGSNTIEAATVENNDNFLAKYSAAGAVEWVRTLKGSKLDNINAMDVANGKVVIGGVIRSEDLVVDNASDIVMKTLDTSGTWNSMLMISFTTDGAYNWNYIAGSINQPTDVLTIAIEKDGTVWNGGTSFGTYYFDPLSEDPERQFKSAAKGGQDMYLLKLSSSGQVLVGYRVGDATKEGASAIMIGEDGVMYVGDMIQTRSKATASPVSLFGEVKSIPTIGTGFSSALLCYQQIYADLATLPTIEPNVAYNQTINAENANGDAEFSLYWGTLPEGITLDVTGKLSGTTTQKGVYPVVFRMQDADGNKGFIEYKIAVSDKSSTASLPSDEMKVWADNGCINVVGVSSEYRVTICNSLGTIVMQTVQGAAGRYSVANGYYNVLVSDAANRIVSYKTMVFKN